MEDWQTICKPKNELALRATLQTHRMQHWEIIADNLSALVGVGAGISAVDSEGRTIWIADARRDNGKRFVVHADEKLTCTFTEYLRRSGVSNVPNRIYCKSDAGSRPSPCKEFAVCFLSQNRARFFRNSFMKTILLSRNSICSLLEQQYSEKKE
jgi:hypothetical protein